MRPVVGQLLAEPVSGRVQPPLDRADRAGELVAHLLERLPLDVERDQRPTVEIAEPIEATPNLPRPLRAQQIIQRRSPLALRACGACPG